QILDREDDFKVVGGVAGGHEALAALERMQPDVVLLELHLPDLASVNLLESLADRDDGPSVLVLSADDREETQLEVARGGARGFVSKAEAVTVLARAIRTVAAGDLWFSPRIASQVLREYHQLVRQTRQLQQPARQLTERERMVLIGLAAG